MGSASPPATAATNGAGLGELPESCVAMVLMNLDLIDICRFATLNQAFRGASDFVWESKFPGNWGKVIEKMWEENEVKGWGKRGVLEALCRGNLIDGGTKKVWLDMSMGGMCFAISAKGLRITGIDDPRYWNHIPSEESGFSTVAYLQQIWWFEVKGEVDFPFPAGTYSVFFRLHLGQAFKRFGRHPCNAENIHGWDIKPVRFQVSTSDGQKAIFQCSVKERGKWINYHAGDFVVENPNKNTTVKFSIDCTHTKGGLRVDSVMICPKSSGRC
ncbi:F-box protein PP2-A12-like protein [Drosera capensis]